MQLRNHRIVAGNHKFSLRFSVFACFWGGGGASQKESIHWNIQRDLGDREGSIKKNLGGGIAMFWNNTFDSFLHFYWLLVTWKFINNNYQIGSMIQLVSLTSLYSGLSVFFLMLVLLLDFLCTSGLR